MLCSRVTDKIYPKVAKAVFPFLISPKSCQIFELLLFEKLSSRRFLKNSQIWSPNGRRIFCLSVWSADWSVQCSNPLRAQSEPSHLICAIVEQKKFWNGFFLEKLFWNVRSWLKVFQIHKYAIHRGQHRCKHRRWNISLLPDYLLHRQLVVSILRISAW